MESSSGVTFLLCFSLVITSVVGMSGLPGFGSNQAALQRLPSSLQQPSAQGMRDLGNQSPAAPALPSLGLGNALNAASETAGHLVSTGSRIVQDPFNAPSHLGAGVASVAGSTGLLAGPMQVMTQNIMRGVQDAVTFLVRNLVDMMPSMMRSVVVKIISNIEAVLLNTPVLGPALNGLNGDESTAPVRGARSYTF